MTQAMIGYDSLYEIMDETLSPPAFVPIGEVFNITPPSTEADRVEATHTKSPQRTREYIPGLVTPGVASFQMNFIPGSDSDALIRAHQVGGITASHRITFPNGVTWTYPASIQSYAPDVPTDNRMTATVSINTGGAITTGTVT